jgi:hypothetical protein
MGWFDWLVTGSEAPTTDATEVVQRIAACSRASSLEHARYLGALPPAAARVAHIDNELTEAEVGAMRAAGARRRRRGA